MRSAHYCKTCEKRLPLCVRSDRKFCTSRCRVWAFRHPGLKRRDYARGRVCLPQAPGRGRPKTLTEALAALEDSRKYAARLESAARQQHSEEQKLLTELATLRDGIAEVKNGLSAERDSARDNLAKTKARLEKVEEQKNQKIKQSHKRLRQTERLLERLKRTEREVTRKEKALDQSRAEQASLRRMHEQQTAEQAGKLANEKARGADLSKARDELAAQVNQLSGTAEQLPQRAADTEQKVEETDAERARERHQTTEPKRAHNESPSLVELLRHRLESEQARRSALEKRLEQLLQTGDTPRPMPAPIAPLRLILASTGLGRFRDHAAAAGYDPYNDPLFALMHDDVTVADLYADWQAKHMQRMTSRRRDPDQTRDEQAYAAAMAARWRLIDHPHIRLGTIPRWSLLGTLLDEKSEKYLLTITNERIEEMNGRIGGRS